MELRQLKYFVEVARLKSYSLASKTLFITQSTISQQIRKLEEELGVELLTRDTRHVELSDYGEQFYPCAVQVLDDAAAACDDKVKPQEDKLNTLKERQSELRKAREGKKDEDVPQAEKDEMKDIDVKISEAENAVSDIYSEYAKGNKVVHELIDLALLQNGMLKGEALAAFIRRSVDLI